MKTLFETLRESHDEQRALSKALTTSASEITIREQLFLRLKVELEAHAAAEERYVYAPMLMCDAGLSAARHAMSEHHEIEQLCEKLSVRKKRGASWMGTARTLEREIFHHLSEEETGFFKLAGRLLGDEQKDELTLLYHDELQRLRAHYAKDYKIKLIGIEEMEPQKNAS